MRCEATFYDAAGGLAPTLEQPSLNDYTQLWVLSGSDLDGGTTQSGQLFADFLTATKGACLPVFVGAGGGNFVHANVVTSALGLGNAFDGPSFPSFDVPWRVEVVDEAAAGDHVLFEGIDRVAESVEVRYINDPNDPSQDYVVVLESDVVVDGPYEDLLTGAGGVTTLAVGSIALPEDGARPFVLDAGLQRFYALPSHPSTKRLLGNLVKLLGNVGCKSEVPK